MAPASLLPPPPPQERELGVSVYLSTSDLEEYGEMTSSSLLYLTLQTLGQCMDSYSLVTFEHCDHVLIH